ncbi:hypothetical protein BH18ACI1_BH18ACI1_20080 [soil metagenome]
MLEHETDNPLYWRDEILQVLYWMTNEGFGQEFAASDLQKFLATEETAITENLKQMVSGGFLERADGNKFKLTAFGKSEGGRRFADEFEEMMKPGHYECADPDCDCHDPDSAGEPCKHLFYSDVVN